MMIKLILVRSTGTEADLPIFRAALSAARLFDAHMTFLHVKADVVATIIAMTSTDVAGTAWLGDTVDQLEKDADALEKTAFRMFLDFCEAERVAVGDTPGPGASAQWLLQVGADDAVIGRVGRMHDLLITGRSQDVRAAGLQLLGSVLMESGRPMLVLPDGAASIAPDVVAIAWKGTPHAAHALAAAASFIDRAKQVVVISVEEEDGPTGDAAQLARCLHWRNRYVEVKHVVPGHDQPVDALLKAAVSEGAGLLVMGGYGHSRLREMVFGGFTRHLLTAAPLPLLVAH